MKSISQIKQDPKAQKSILILLKLLKKVMVVFSTIFLNVYIFQALDNNFTIYLGGLIASIVFAEIFSLIIFSILSKKNAMLIYRMSFVFDAILIILVILIKTPTLPIIFMFYALQELSNCCFYGPHEIGEMKATSHKDSSKFLSLSTIMTSIVGVISPFFSGLIVDRLSYTILFIIVGVVAIIMLIFSFYMKDFDIVSRKLKIKEFCSKSFKKPHMGSYYFSFLMFRFSTGGTIYTILPVVLFMKTGSEFSLGTYSSLFALLTIITLLIFMFVKRKKIFTCVSVALICLSCLVLSIWSTFIVFVIFNAIYYSFGKIYENEIFSTRLNVIKTNELSMYKKEHHVMYDIFANIGYLCGYLFIMLLYNVIKLANALTIIIGILGMLMIVSLILLLRAQKYYQFELLKEEINYDIDRDSKQNFQN